MHITGSANLHEHFVSYALVTRVSALKIAKMI